MNYQQTIGYLFGQLPMFHRIGPAAYKANLDNTLALSEHFNHPEQQFPTIHIAGTNGKGSVAHMLAAVLQQQGYKTALATSPHLKDFRERIRVNGKMIPKSFVAHFVTQNKAFFDKIKPSFFELTIALSFSFFAHQEVDVAVVETGLGGRLDSTNIITPQLSVITNIGLDHTNLLGNTLEEIAREKAGIIKPGVPLVVGRRQDLIHYVFEETARKHQSTLHVASDHFKIMDSSMEVVAGKNLQKLSYRKNDRQVDLLCDLLGSYQRENVATVLQAVDVINASGKFTIHESSLTHALGNVSSLTGLRGRWQIIGKRPLIVCDTAHNADGLQIVMGQIKSLQYQQLHMVFGMVDDKDIDAVLALLPQKAHYYFCKPNVPRGMDPRLLKEKASAFGLVGNDYESVNQALRHAKAQANGKDLIFVGGSTFVVAEVI